VIDSGSGQSNFYTVQAATVTESLPERFNTADGHGMIANGTNYADVVYANAIGTDAANNLSSAIAQEVTDRNTAISNAIDTLHNQVIDENASWSTTDGGSVTSMPVDVDFEGQIVVFDTATNVSLTCSTGIGTTDFSISRWARVVNIGGGGITISGAGCTFIGSTNVAPNTIATIYRYDE